MDRFLQDRLDEMSRTPAHPVRPTSATKTVATDRGVSCDVNPRSSTKWSSVEVIGLGRASRKEYIPVFILCGAIQRTCEAAISSSGVCLAVSILAAVALIVESSRRLHDIGRSGWWLLVPVYSLVLLFRKGDEGPNAYGPDPRQRKRKGMA